ncbi:MAG: hypothetical protein CHACPFDD_02358 [Phycisphaerae bacterium]|nr:hypothetical protein [Phycisphaerae bacterium]
MSATPRRSGRAYFATLFVAAFPLAISLSTASAENRKFVVFLADLPKEAPDAFLPLRTDIWDAYFDKVKNGQPGQPRIDSFAEWWEEVSYGDVTVDGEVGGWVSMPWPSHPPGLTGGLFSNDVIPHVDLQSDFSYAPDTGEFFFNGIAMYSFDFDGVGENAARGNAGARGWPGVSDADVWGNPVWAPGERFQNLNGNLDSAGRPIYDAGVFEIAIDKNGNGKIDLNKKANSFAQLIASEVDYGPVDARYEIPIWIRFLNDTEWFDWNGSGEWDWGGAEIWIDRDSDGALGGAAEPYGDDTDRPATLIEFIMRVGDPEDDETEWWDQQLNDNYDYPEPYEDFLVHWSPFAHQFVTTDDEYIIANYPGSASAILGRIGNRHYDAPDYWDNNGNTISTNKMQRIEGNLKDDTARAAQRRRWSFTSFTTEPTSPDGTPLWWSAFWTEFFGTEAPEWFGGYIPYLQTFDPAKPVPQLVNQTTEPTFEFHPNRGGPNNNGTAFAGESFGGDIVPRVNDPNEGMYDGPAEYWDLPSSIYHAGGDGYFGEVTSPADEQLYGDDLGSTPPSGGVGAGGDANIEPAGPLAYNVHGEGGNDGGNVLTTEFLTWRTDGTSSTDVDQLVGGQFIRRYGRDINLDGLLDMGETIVPGNHNYGIDALEGGTPNADPAQNVYPWNRMRLQEDMIAAMDASMDFDEFLGGPGDYGNVINSVILCPAGTAANMFFLTAGGYQATMVRDGLDPLAVSSRLDINQYRVFTDGLGISTDSAGEGDLGVGAYQTPFSAHEYCHRWEGYPDLYDYDVYLDFGGKNLNYPIGRWCIMAGGGLVHPVPILKAVNSDWIDPVDITTALTPAASTTITFRSWEFDRNRTLYVFRNPTYAAESFWFWRQSPVALDPDTGAAALTFDQYLPGHGLMIMHVDERGNPNGTPPQQRLSGHFTYLIVQADGLHDLELDNSPNAGDAGDPFPGTSGRTTWNRFTDPSNKWYTDEGSGLDITNIVEKTYETDVTFRWTPRELPSFDWVQPPGGTSVNGQYNLRYYAYDQKGGTTIRFYVDDDSTGYDGAFLGATGKPLGDVDGAFKVNIGNLPNGTYAFYAKLEPGATENSVSVPRPNVDNQGNGVLEMGNADVDLAVSQLEAWSVVCSDDTVRNKELWTITGTASGQQVVKAVTGQVYQSDPISFGGGSPHSAIKFKITPGAKRFRVGDRFSFVTTGFTRYSDAVLIFEGNIVQPGPPVALIDSVTPATGISNWTEFTFASNSNDPADADFTETWSFGDGQTSGVQTTVPSVVTHKYANAGTFVVTLTVTNSFGLSATATTAVQVTNAKTPVARLTASPAEGRLPLKVTLDASKSSDQNDPGLGGSNLTYRWTTSSGAVLDPVAGTPSEGDIVVKPGPAQGPFDVIFNKAGVQVVTVEVTNGFGQKATAPAEVRVQGPPADQPPIAEISADKRSGAGPLVVKFSAAGSRDPEGGLLEYAWNFGDGSHVVRGVSEATHTYSKARTYNATLTVTDPSGSTDSATLAIVVTSDAASSNGSPVARINVSSTQGAAPFTVEFNALDSADPEGDALSYAWDFGDGSAPEFGPVVAHTYEEARTYSVVLTVADPGGSTGSATVNISVTLPVDQSGRESPSGDGTGDATDGGSRQLCGAFGFFPIMLTLAGMLALRRRRVL